jgi:hypothetical protein
MIERFQQSSRPRPYRSRNAPDRLIVEPLTAPGVYFGGSGRGIFGGDTNPRLSFGRYYGSR